MRIPLRGILVVLGLALVLGCLQPGKDPDFARGEPQALAGAWHFRLLQSGGEPVVGVVELDSQVTTDSMLHYRSVAGTFRVDSVGFFARQPGAQTAVALLAPDGQVFVHLHYGGRCGDCGDLTLVGRLEEPGVKGRWVQEFLGKEPSGRFEMSRIQ